VITFQDVTEEERLRENMRRVERLASLGTMAAGIAHEIRNPLANIRIAVQSLGKRLSAQHSHRDFPQRIIKEIDRLSQLLHDFLAFARPPKPNRQPTRLEDIIEEVTLFLRDQLLKGRVRVIKEFAPNVPQAEVDKALMQQVFVNLILNAIQAMPTGGEILIQVQEIADQERQNGGHFLRISLKDNGPGIPPGDLERIFDPFYTTKPQGTGLGLSVVHQIIREHEGWIRAESEWGKGATFIIDLPPPA
jgi:signal transduction histidine kinase